MSDAFLLRILVRSIYRAHKKKKTEQYEHIQQLSAEQQRIAVNKARLIQRLERERREREYKNS